MASSRSLQGLQGYMFEPNFTEAELQAMEAAEEEGEENIGRAGNCEWCTCVMCSAMSDDKQSVCCNEVDDVLKKKAGNVECITLHESFERTVLNKEALKVLRIILSIHEKDAAKLAKLRTMTNKSWRYLAYRQFWFWINSFRKYGKYVRFVIPACAVHAIRNEYPEEDGNYTGFKEVDFELPA